MSCMFRLSLRTSSGLETVILLSQGQLKTHFHLLKNMKVIGHAGPEADLREVQSPFS